MKATGCTRPIDKLGRVVIPMELRRTLALKTGDVMAFFVDGESIVLQKHNPGCTFCGNMDDMTEFGGQKVCSGCKDEIRKAPR